MTDTVTIIVDDIKITVPKGLTVVDAAKRAGVDIPVFCYHPKLPVVGMCRMCLVEIGTPKLDPATRKPVLDAQGNAVIAWNPKLQTACTTTVSEGMAVHTDTPEVKAAQKAILEFLLTSHPLDCPICQKGGECPLQNLTLRHGPGASRFPYESKQHLAKHKPLGDLIFLDMERCIQCSRCIRFQEDIADDHVLGFDERGRRLQIVTYSDPPFDSKFSGNTTDVCPVGALLTADYHHSPRPWEVKPVASICPHCAVGCNLVLNTRVNDHYIARALPRQNEQVNELWICDKGRFGHHFASDPARLKWPLVVLGDRLVETTWGEAMELVLNKLQAAGAAAGGIAGDRLAVEDLYLFQCLFRQGLKSPHVDQWPNRVGGGELVAQVGLARGSDFSAWGPQTAVLVVASDLEEEAPIWWLRLHAAAKRGAKLIVANARPTKTDRRAAFTLRYGHGDEVTVLNALLKAVLDAGLENRDFVAARVDGLDALRAELAGIRAPAGISAADLEGAARDLAQAENLVVVYGADGLSYEGSQALAQAAANVLIVTGHVGRPNNGLLPVWPHNNTQGAWDMGLRPDLLPGYAPAPAVGKTAAAMLAGGVTTLFLAGADPVGDDPALADALRQFKFVAVTAIFLTETAKLAHVVLPAQSFAEREGVYTNGARRVQRFYPAIPPVGEARPDWKVFAQLGARMGLPPPPASTAAVMAHIAREVPIYAGMTYGSLAQVEKEYPDMGGRSLYYGGTAHRNTAGQGIVWPAHAENPGARLGVHFVAGAAAGAPPAAPGPVRLYRAGAMLTGSPLQARIVKKG